VGGSEQFRTIPNSSEQFRTKPNSAGCQMMSSSAQLEWRLCGKWFLNDWERWGCSNVRKCRVFGEGNVTFIAQLLKWGGAVAGWRGDREGRERIGHREHGELGGHRDF